MSQKTSLHQLANASSPRSNTCTSSTTGSVTIQTIVLSYFRSSRVGRRLCRTPEESPVRSQWKELLEFLDFIDKQQQLSDDLKLLFKNVAVTLYAGALRIFQPFLALPWQFLSMTRTNEIGGSVSRERETGQHLNKRLWIEILQMTRERISPQEWKK